MENKTTTIKKHIPALIISPILIIGLINNVHKDHLVLKLHGVDALFNLILLSITLGVPFTLFSYVLFKSNDHLILKSLKFILGTPVILLFSLVFGSQTILSFKTNFVLSSKAKKVIEHGVIEEKDSYNNHGKKYVFYLKTKSEDRFKIPSNKSEYESVKIGDSLKIKYYKNIHGTIYTKYGDMRAK